LAAVVFATMERHTSPEKSLTTEGPVERSNYMVSAFTLLSVFIANSDPLKKTAGDDSAVFSVLKLVRPFFGCFL
jgi:hypothetical protein